MTKQLFRLAPLLWPRFFGTIVLAEQVRLVRLILPFVRGQL